MQQALAVIAASQEHQFNAAYPRPNQDDPSDIIRLRLSHSASSGDKFNAVHARPNQDDPSSIYTDPAPYPRAQNKYNAAHTRPNHEDSSSITRFSNTSKETSSLAKFVHTASQAQAVHEPDSANIHVFNTQFSSMHRDGLLAHDSTSTRKSGLQTREEMMLVHQDVGGYHDHEHVAYTNSAHTDNERAVPYANQAGSKKTAVKHMIEPKNAESAHNTNNPVNNQAVSISDSDSLPQRMYSIELKHLSQISDEIFAGEQAQKLREIQKDAPPTAAEHVSESKSFPVRIRIPGDVGMQKDVQDTHVGNVTTVSSSSATSASGGYWGDGYSASMGTSRELHACV
jgi:hypothetical protein